MVVRRSNNGLVDVPYSALFCETLCVAMWTIVSLAMCLAALSLNAPLSRKQGCNAVMFARRKHNSNKVLFETFKIGHSCERVTQNRQLRWIIQNGMKKGSSMHRRTHSQSRLQ